MPYVSKDRRRHLDRKLENFFISDVGSMNYVLTKLINNYCHINNLSYRTINDIIGVLECVKQEFYRRVAVEFENKKVKENGDIEWPMT